MARWDEVAAAAPELAKAVRERLDAGVHKTLATVRADGSPRISGTEIEFRDGDIWFGSMWQSRKARDLQRDPRFALHSASADPSEWKGDAKLSGRVEEVTDPAAFEAQREARGGEAPSGPYHLFRADITEMSVVRLGDPPDHLVIESWHPGRGVERRERR
jgi:Pyridoxamine 5'-phosphate oxidase